LCKGREPYPASSKSIGIPYVICNCAAAEDDSVALLPTDPATVLQLLLNLRCVLICPVYIDKGMEKYLSLGRKVRSTKGYLD